jgi:hypothetical protein
MKMSRRWNGSPCKPGVEAYRVHISENYRAIYMIKRLPDGTPIYVWDWIGTRESFANYVGCR